MAERFRTRVPTGTGDVLARHGDQLHRSLALAGRSRPRSAAFAPEFALPEPSRRFSDFSSVVTLPFRELGRVGRTDLVLLDLMGNPGTRTAKTLASTVIVARAVRHIDRTGEPIVIVTPSSANESTALRDAVLRAYQVGLADPDTLRIVSLVPDSARPRLWASELSEDPTLAARNPLCVLDKDYPGDVRTVALRALDEYADDVYEVTGARLWHTLDLADYRCADAVRAFAEYADLPSDPARRRTHAHAVSSAFGLLGHHFGTTLLPEPTRSRYFLVQHLATPDMVRSLYGITPPYYGFHPATGLYRQDEEPRYPATTFDVAENLEPTFSLREPTTSPAMTEIIRTQGGGGIVVSLHECLTRYGRIRSLLGGAGVTLPADPRSLREWSLVMVMTGVLNGIERGLVDADEVVVHASGSYDASHYTPIPRPSLLPVGGVADLRAAILGSAPATRPLRRVA